MGTRPTRLVTALLLLGLTVLAAVWTTAGSAASQQPGPSVVAGGVDASGAPSSPTDGWRVVHPTKGVYEVAVDADSARLDVSRWDAAADVTILPLGGGASEVRFTRDGRPVESGFSFTAITGR